jgi:hypothetical protein
MSQTARHNRLGGDKRQIALRLSAINRYLWYSVVQTAMTADIYMLRSTISLKLPGCEIVQAHCLGITDAILDQYNDFQGAVRVNATRDVEKFDDQPHLEMC